MCVREGWGERRSGRGGERVYGEKWGRKGKWGTGGGGKVCVGRGRRVGGGGDVG